MSYHIWYSSLSVIQMKKLLNSVLNDEIHKTINFSTLKIDSISLSSIVLFIDTFNKNKGKVIN
ncbi:MAG: hypothetical protein KDE33_02040 [Bacteroidetes bacterium]|nr:hypothetical protein [Bacteroidota bacterium]